MKVQDNKTQFVSIDDPIQRAEAAAVISRADDPFLPPTATQIRRHDMHWNANYLKERHFLLRDGKPIACIVVMEPCWFQADDLLSGRPRCIPDYESDTFVPMIRLLEDRAHELGKKRVLTHVLGVYENRIRTLQDHGFQEKMRFPITSLKLVDLDRPRYLPVIERLKAEGVRFLTYRDYVLGHPAREREYYDFSCEIMVDVPSPEPFKPEPFEDWMKFMNDPEVFDAEWLLLAVEDDKIVGCSGIERNRVKPGSFETGLTGVLRSHRRRGLATALKVEVLSRARDAGGKEVFTDNEENNPMLQLNYQLGFKQRSFIAEFHKTL